MKRIISMVLSLVMLVSLLGVNVSSEWTEPTENTSLYSWPTAPTAENIFGGSGAFEKNAGTWSSMTDTTASFDDTEKAILLNNDGGDDTNENYGKYDYFSHDLDGEITQGQVDVTFNFKTNGAYLGIILDSGEKETSTLALSISPWGVNGDKTWPAGFMGNDKFPWPDINNKFGDFQGLGNHGDDKFGSYWTVVISARPEDKKYTLDVKYGENQKTLAQTEFDMKDSKIKRIVFGQYDGVDWNAKTYVKNINIDYKKVWKAPTTDTNLYSWPSEPTADNVWDNGLEKNGGSWNGNKETVEKFDADEKAIRFHHDSSYDYFRYNMGGAIKDGTVDLSFKFKTNGQYFGVLLDSGNGTSDSTVALTIHPWGTWNNGPSGKNLTARIGYGTFPFDATPITESNELGQHTDNGYGEWINVKISAKPELKKFDLIMSLPSGAAICNKSNLDMKGTQISGISFGSFDDLTWDASTYIKDISVSYKEDGSVPITYENLYTYPTEPTADNIWSGGLAQNGGSWNGNAATEVEFDATEGALLLNNDGVENAGKYDYFNYAIGKTLTSGQVELNFKFKTNGSYIGVILDSGTAGTSTPAIAINPWGQTNTWINGVVDRYAGEIKTGKFPWEGTELSESRELGQHSDDGFDPWLTARVLARPSEQKYDVIIKQGEKLVAEGFDLDMSGTQISGIVFASFDDLNWNAKTFVKDITVDYTDGERVASKEAASQTFESPLKYVKVEYDTVFNNKINDIEELHFIQAENDVTVLKLRDRIMSYCGKWNDINTSEGTYHIKAIADITTGWVGYVTVEVTAPNGQKFVRQGSRLVSELTAVDKIVIKSDNPKNVSNVKINVIGDDDLLKDLSLSDISFIKNGETVNDIKNVPIDLTAISIDMKTPLFDKATLDEKIYIKKDGVKIDAKETEYSGNTFTIKCNTLSANSDYELFVDGAVAKSDKSFGFKTEKAVSAKILSIKNSSGTDVTAVSKADNKLTVASSMRNTLNSEKSYSVIAAVYGANSNLADIKFGENHSTASDAEFSDEFELDNLSGAKEIKFFVWDGTGAIKPYSKAITIAEDLFDDGEVDKLVTTFIGDAKTTRGFSWSSALTYNDMAIEYKTAASDWNSVDATLAGTYNAAQNCWEADITKLSPGTEYSYRLYDKSAKKYTQTYSFKTEDENVTKFSFIGFTDSQSGLVDEDSDDWTRQYEYFKNTVDKAMLDAPNAAFMLQGGDLVNAGSKISMWNNYFKAIQGVGESVPHMATAGNHEYNNYDFKGAGDEEPGKAFAYFFNNPDNGRNALGSLKASDNWEDADKRVLKYIDDTIYSFDYANAHITVLNTGSNSTHGGCEDIVSAQVDWLKSDLQNTSAKWKIVMLHQGLYERAGSSTRRDILEKTLQDCGVDLVIYGHDHEVIRTYAMKDAAAVVGGDSDKVVKGSGTVHQMLGVSGSAADGSWVNIPEYVSVFSGTYIGDETYYAVYEVSQDSIDVIVKSVKGTIIDKFSITDAQ